MSGWTRRDFLRWSAAAAFAPQGTRAPPVPEASPGQVAPLRHAALYLYTRSLVRPRHAAVVRKALAQRIAAHESGWGQTKDGPLQELGPVRRAGHWKGDRLIKQVSMAWPFAAVLEYSGEGEVKAWLDWCRRRRGNPDPGGWFLDPPGIYVDHLNAETVCDQDDRWCYMAVVDTPTGAVIGSNEFAVRGRVQWGDGTRAARGWWLRFETPGSCAAEDFVEEMIPLVEWRVLSEDRRNGVNASAPVEEPARQLAVWGTKTVFEFPPIPDGVRPCTGRR